MSQPASTSTASAPPCVAPSEPTTWFKEEVQPHERQLRGYLRGQFPAVRDVDDVVQESYLKIWQARAKTPIASAKAFLFRIARNLALDLVRRDRASPVDSSRSPETEFVLDHGPNAIEVLLTHETLQLMAQAIAALPPKERDVILLHKVGGLTQKETAERLSVPLRTVENRTLQALSRCQAFLSARGIKHFFD